MAFVRASQRIANYFCPLIAALANFIEVILTMIDDEEINKLIIEAELLLEGLPKGFWRLIKLSVFEIWETPEDAEFEYVWVVAVFGNRCVYY
ncbi:MAG: hypothetical protein GY787_05900, partial [Alteromonadales bacterium]|nr:hypothetical protein [Alteromonadales bacterium]